MRKNRYILFSLIVLFSLLFSINVFAAGYSIDAGGTPSGGGSGGGSGHTSVPALLGCWGIKVNLVKVSDSSIDLASSFVVFSDTQRGSYNNSNKIYYDIFMGWQSAKNVGGGGRVYGQLTNGGYDYGPTYTKIRTTNGLGVGDFYIKNNNSGTGVDGRMFGFDASKARNNLMTKRTSFTDTSWQYDSPSDIAIKLLYELLTPGDNMITGSAFPSDFDMSGVNSWEDLKWRILDAYDEKSIYHESASQLMVPLNGYEIIIEPIYAYAKISTGSYMFLTSKATASKFLNRELTGIVYSYQIGDNCFSSNAHGPINKNGLPTQDGGDNDIYTRTMDPNNGYGYLIITITNDYVPKPEVEACPPGTEGKNGGSEPFYNYYMFAYLGNQIDAGQVSDNTSKNTTYNTLDLYKEIIDNANNNGSGKHYTMNGIQIASKKNIPITKDSLRDFYKHLKTASDTRPKAYYKESNGDYYIWHTQYTNKGEVYEGSDFLLPEDYFVSHALLLQEPQLKINPIMESDKTFSFEVHREYPNPLPEPQFADGFYSPALYRIGYCITPEKDESVCPEGTEGKNGGSEPYHSYYMFLYGGGGIDDGGDSYNVASNSKFKTLEIYQKLLDEKNKNAEGKKYTMDGITLLGNPGKNMYLTYSDVDTFYNHLNTADKSSGKYYMDSNGDYYLTHSSYINKGHEIQTDMNLPDIETFRKQALLLSTKESLEVSAQEQADKNLIFTIKRKFPPLSDYHRDNGFYSPALFRVDFCMSGGTEVNCKDDVTSSVCNSSDNGSQAVYHESDNLKTCTVDNNTESGFTVLNKDDTAGYCEMACKEDLDIYVPGTKETRSGGYFKLDRYVPTIAAKRTCVTTQIKYDTLDDKLASIEPTMIKNYNDWQDFADIVPRLTGTSSTSTGTCTHTWCSSYGTDSSGNTICTGTSSQDYTYTIETWSMPSQAAINYSSNSFPGDSGVYNSTTPCSGGGITLNQAISIHKADYNARAATSHSLYNQNFRSYQSNINGYNACFNWSSNTNSTKDANGPNLSLVTNNKYNKYKYQFEPTVTFNYPDKDGSVFPVGYTYKYGTSDVHTDKALTTALKYWGKGTGEIDEEYSGGASSITSTNRELVQCSGKTCSGKISSSFYTDEYVKREEEITYSYHLPKLYTRIPDGTVSKSGGSSGKTMIELEPEAVPVNINTRGGTNEYRITIKDIKDKVRKEAASKSPNDTWDTRFVERKVLNEGSDYVCNYKVVNDIYIPTESKYNFFYRIVDPANINPTNRTLGYNWSSGKGQTVQTTMAEAAADYQVQTNSANRDKFVFTLTPVTMKSIRTYNAKQTKDDSGYADWDLRCFDYGPKGYHCYSNFLTCLASGGGTNEGLKNCNEIFGNSLSDYSRVSNYNDTALGQNRDILIAKQNRLDGR